MPCFMVGKGIADAVSKFTSSRLYYTSHQVGHILAALYSVGRLDLVTEDNDGEFSYPAIIADQNHLYITYTWRRKKICFAESIFLILPLHLL